MVFRKEISTMRLILLLCVLGVGIHCQTIFQDCPTDWLKNGNNCLKFVGYPRLQLNGATAFCRGLSATLVSINDPQEHTFITGWLEKNDGRRDTWLTSGIVSNGVRWLGDGTGPVSFNYWLPSYVSVPKLEGDSVNYAFSGIEYGWGIADTGKNSSFICEIPLSEVYKIGGEARDFDYGLDVEDPYLAPRGPKFIFEPVETTILSLATTAAYFDCQASGSPEPEYTWLRGDGANMNVLKTGPGTRFALTGGRLTIDFPIMSDEGVYQCKAYNQFGSILSRRVSLSFGTIGEFSNIPTSDITGELYNGAVINCPRITAKPAISYQWYKNSIQSFIRSEVQAHTFISNNGKLYFSELASSDSGTYYCIVSLTTEGGRGNYIGSSQDVSRTSLGFSLVVKSGGNSQFQPVIQDDFINVYPGNPKQGQTIQMECFAYGTGPLVYQWFRVGKDMPATATFSSTRRVLTITNVQLEDSGQYKCRVDSRTTHLSDEKTYVLNIQAEPYFSYPLDDQHVDVGGRLTWHCEARGKPTPTYLWYKNSQLLLSSSGVTVNGNSLTIEVLQKERDDGMYQCAAKNLYGVAFSSAQIRVLEFAPTFAKHPVAASLSAAVGGNVTIICNPESAPAPTYQWYRNDIDLQLQQGGSANNRLQLFLNGNLLITDVNLGDQGKYTCKATNSKGTAQSSGILRVFESVVISQRPQSVTVEVNSTATLTCSSSSPNNVDVVYAWYFGDHLIDFSIDIEFRMGSGATSGNLYIIGAQFKHEGLYTCQVTSGTTAVSSSAYLTVRGPPGEPAGVFQGDNLGLDYQVVAPSDRVVQLYWSDGDSHGSSILAYTVEFRTNFDQRWRTHPQADRVSIANVQSIEYPDKRTIFLHNLKPGAGHEFRVSAINAFGIGAPSLPTAMIQVPGIPPNVAPSGISGGGGSVGDLSVIWQPMAPEDHSGPGLRYVVHWREKQASVESDTRWNQKSTSPDEACFQKTDTEKGLISLCRFVVLVGREFFYKPYEVRVQAANDYGLGVISDIVTIMSAEEMPSGTPRNVMSVSYNATALMVYWTPVPNTREYMKGKLLGYRINYWMRDNETEDQARYNFIRIPWGMDNIDHGLIIGLFPRDWYIVNVQTYNSAGFGPKSEDYPQQTTNSAPALYPTEVYVYSIEGTGLQVNFRGISTNVAEEPLMGYKVQYWPSGENIRKAQEMDIGRSNQALLTNVSESVLYELRIFGYSRGGQGKRSSPTVYFTVGEGQLIYNPETTEVMAGNIMLKASAYTLVMGLLCFLMYMHH
ncbi:contactin-like isoform X2 [Pomacea canaliculata]|uniref:contactin-like isoform X2 n=1 Tax=Pomacea canaliculata TaxID=400727 RepID=UPI000D73B270|nr:contactin-like isoform X2 [Pomacea canaliculata]